MSKHAIFVVTLCAQIDPILNTFIAQTFQLLLVGKNGDTGAPAQSLAAEERRPGRELAIMRRGLNRADDEDDGDYEDIKSVDYNDGALWRDQ